MLNRQDSVVRRMLQRWQQGTRVLPALRFDHTRLIRAAWSQWRERAPAAAASRRAVDMDRKGMLGKAMRHWIKAAKAKRSMRAAA
jgi:hypothetical protein